MSREPVSAIFPALRPKSYFPNIRHIPVGLPICQESFVARTMISRHTTSLSDDLQPILTQVQALVRPLKAAADLDPIVDRIGDARYVLLGGAAPGTSECYLWRHRLTERLIREKGFSFVGFEADWAGCYPINRYVRSLPNSSDDPEKWLRHAVHWPAWTWASHEIVSLVEGLCSHNDSLPAEQRVGLYGLDAYGLWNSWQAVLQYLEGVNPAAAAAQRRAMECFEPYLEDLQEYAQATAGVPESHTDELIAMLCKLRDQAPRFADDGREGAFHAEQIALAVAGGEPYYRTLLRGGLEAWNLHQRHMVETIERLMHHSGPKSKAIVCAHNTHIGDARFTDMGAAGMVNVGQLLRETHAPHDVVLVGFGSYGGKVVASPSWGEPAQRMDLPPAAEGSWEDILHRVTPGDKILVLGATAQTPELLAERGHRAVGVVYRPQAERYGNYIPTVLPRRYDAFIYSDQTQALHPLATPGVDQPMKTSHADT